MYPTVLVTVKTWPVVLVTVKTWPVIRASLSLLRGLRVADDAHREFRDERDGQGHKAAVRATSWRHDANDLRDR